MKIRYLVILLLLLPACTESAAWGPMMLSGPGVASEDTSGVLFYDDFDAWADWTVTQPSSTAANCLSSCSLGDEWDMYRNGFCICANELEDEPGNNNFYVDQYAGYPDETNTCHGGSGKCAIHWAESCSDLFDQSDWNLGVDLGQEYEEIYLRWYIRFKSSWETGADEESGMKLYHIQHYDPAASETPWVYFGTAPSNTPTSSGGLNKYSNTIQFYSENRCQCIDEECSSYYCNDITVWQLGSTTWAYAAGGIYDGDWHCLELHIKRDSEIGGADGVIELWFDGTKKNYLSGYSGTSREYNPTGSSELRGWRHVSLFGNNDNHFDTSCATVADCEQWYAIDDVVISTEYIGVE